MDIKELAKHYNNGIPPGQSSNVYSSVKRTYSKPIPPPPPPKKTDGLEDAKAEELAEDWVTIETTTETSVLSRNEIERIYERKYDDRVEIFIRTKSGDCVQTGFKTLIEAKQMCL